MTDDQIESRDLQTEGADEAAVTEKVAEIEATREEMTGTVEAIGDRLDPKRIVDDAKETVREATVGKVETMAAQAGETFSDAGMAVQGAGSGLLETVKKNPVPAAMAALGIGWLLTHRESGDSKSSNGYRSGSSASWQRQDDYAWAQPGRSHDMRSDADRTGPAEKIGQTVGDAAETVGQRVGDVGDRLGELPRTVGDSGVMRQAQRLLDESPLAVGAAALAVGATIGMVLPSTRMERDVLGPTSQKLIGTAEQKATEAIQEARSDTGGTSSPA